MENKKRAKKEDEKFSLDFSCVNERVIPKKDHVIMQNEFYYELKKGEPIEVNKRFIQALKTENVI